MKRAPHTTASNPVIQRSGTQSIERAALLLRHVALRSQIGWGLSELSRFCELDKATTFRIITGLVNQRLLQQSPIDRKYRPGPLLFEMGLSVPDHASFLALCHVPLRRLARQFRAIATLTLKSEDQGVKAARATGMSSKGLTAYIGQHRPLVTTTGGIAILITLPEADAEQIINQNFRTLRNFGKERIRAIEKVINKSRKLGFAISENETTRGLSTFGIAITTSETELGTALPLGAISLV